MDNEFRNLSDEQLAALCRKGEKGAYTALVGRYLFAVRSRAANYEGSGIDFEDLVQEGLIGLMNAVSNFNDSFGAAFSTFAFLCIDRNIISAVRKSLGKKQIPASALVFIEDESALSDHSESPEAVVISNENIGLLKKRISDKLSETEKNVLELYLLGLTYENIAKRLNCTPKSVDNAVQRIRKKLR